MEGFDPKLRVQDEYYALGDMMAYIMAPTVSPAAWTALYWYWPYYYPGYAYYPYYGYWW